MIKIDEIKKLKIKITWTLIYCAIIEGQLDTQDAIDFAIEEIERGSNEIEVYELAGLCADDREEVLRLLSRLVKNEGADFAFEKRKINAIIVNNTLEQIDSNPVKGLIELSELWISLGLPDYSPHIIQGRDNDISIEKYYTQDNYSRLLQKNINWLKEELDEIRKV